MAGTYPILGDPSLAWPPRRHRRAAALISDLSSAAHQLGAGQAIDLLKGMVMPAIMSAIQSAAPRRGCRSPPPQSGGLTTQETCYQTAPQGGLVPSTPSRARRLCGAVAGSADSQSHSHRTVSKHW